MLSAAQVLVNAYRPVVDEVDVQLPFTRGVLPAELRGVLYRNGPGRLDVHGVQQMHPFDGDGMVSRFAMTSDGIRYRNRYVRTREFEAEAKAQRMLYRGFGTNVPGGVWRNLLRMRFKNAANTSVVAHGGRLFALWEAGLPHALEPDTLETLGRFDFDGALRSSGSPLERLLVGERPFSAHPKVNPETGTLMNFGLLVGPKPRLLVYRVAPDGRFLDTRSVVLDETSFIHDFAITSEYAVFFATPVRFDVPRALSGLSTPVDSLRGDSTRPTQIVLLPHDGRPATRIDAPSGFFLFHYFDAFDRGSDRITVYGCRMDGFVGGTIDLRDPDALEGASFEPAFATRWDIDMTRRQVTEHRLSDVPMELPFIDPRRVGQGARLGYTVARTRPGSVVYHGIARIELDTGHTDIHDFAPDIPGEPVFVPRRRVAPEGEGFLLTLVYRAERHRTELRVLDAQSLDTLAAAELPHHHPPGFHGCFVPSV